LGDGGFAAARGAEELAGAIGDELVGVHVCFSAGAGLPDCQGKVVDEVEGGVFAGDTDDCVAEGSICEGGELT
jgi:hypothetical protein